jgi:hypothetical protein
MLINETSDHGRGLVVERAVARRTPRYSFVVDVEMADLQSGSQIRGRTKQLSVLGCGLDALRLFPKGTNVKITLTHRGAQANVLARIVYASAELGMGLAFTHIESEDERILKSWLEEYLSIPNQGK